MTPAMATGCTASQINRVSQDQRPILSIQCGKTAFLGGGAADNNATVPQAVEIKGMQRLAVFQHDVIRHVHQVVYSPEATGLQSPPQPERRGPNLEVYHHAGGIAGAVFRVFDVHRGPAVRGFRHLRQIPPAGYAGAGPAGQPLPGPIPEHSGSRDGSG